MKKILVGLFFFITTYLYAYELHVIIEPGHCATHSGYVKDTVLKYLVRGQSNLKFYINGVKIKSLGKKSTIRVLKKRIGRLCKRKGDFDIIEQLNDLGGKEFGKKGKILFFSNMSYKNPEYEIDFTGKVPNDAWLSSRYSPFKKKMDKWIENKTFKNKDVIIITNESKISLKKYQEKKRFYYLMFKKLGAKLKYYGPYVAYTANYGIIKDYFSRTNHVYDYKLSKERILDSQLLMLDDRTINLNLGE